MSFYINNKKYGLFIGEFLGLEFFTKIVESDGLQPFKFKTKDDAENYLNSLTDRIPEDFEIIKE